MLFLITVMVTVNGLFVDVYVSQDIMEFSAIKHQIRFVAITDEVLNLEDIPTASVTMVQLKEATPLPAMSVLLLHMKTVLAMEHGLGNIVPVMLVTMGPIAKRFVVLAMEHGKKMGHIAPVMPVIVEPIAKE